MKTSLPSSLSVPLYSPSRLLPYTLSLFSYLITLSFSLSLIFLPSLLLVTRHRRQRLPCVSSSTLVTSDGFLDISLWNFRRYFLYFKETRISYEKKKRLGRCSFITICVVTMRDNFYQNVLFGSAFPFLIPTFAISLITVTFASCTGLILLSTCLSKNEIPDNVLSIRRRLALGHRAH